MFALYVKDKQRNLSSCHTLVSIWSQNYAKWEQKSHILPKNHKPHQLPNDEQVNRSYLIKTKKSRFPSPNLGIIQIHLLLQTTGLKKLYKNRTICPTNTAPASPLGNLSTIMKKATYLCNTFFCSSFDRLESTSVRRFQFSLSGIRTLTDRSLTSWLAE